MKNFHKSAGITLMELMIVVAIIGIIGAFAYPAYQDYVREARRAEGRNLLLQAANREERFFADNNTYTNVMTQLSFAADPAVSENAFYTVDATAASATAYSLTATAQNLQATDTECATITLNSLGQKGSTGGGDCWN